MKKPLGPGDHYCKHCNGTGKDPRTVNDNPWGAWECDYCNGEGKLDWIENVVGKKIETFDLGFFEDNDIGLGYLSHPDNIYLDE